MIPYLKVKNAVGRRQLHGRLVFRGLPVSIENAKSSSRQWYNPDVDKYGITRMDNPYGYVRGTMGVDGDAVDVYIGPDRESDMVFIIHQKKAPDFVDYDEDKCFLGFESEEAAREAYLKHFDDPRFLGPITAMTFEEFREKLESHRGKMIKSHIHSYTRTTASGKTVFVGDHEDKRRVYVPDNSKRESEIPITAPNGRDNFGSIMGEVAMKAGMPPGPIKLLQGDQFADHKGFGKKHIQEQHGAELRAAGFKTEEDFLADVIKNYDSIYHLGGKRYALVADGQKQKVHIVEIKHDPKGSFYNVITGYIADRRQFYDGKFKLLWKRGGLRKSGEEICRKIGDDLGVDWNEVDFDQFADGMFDEDDHGLGVKKTAQIVLDHLKEDPNYYTKLKAAGLAKAFPLFLFKKKETCEWLL
jgi:hypothetical protein